MADLHPSLSRLRIAGVFAVLVVALSLLGSGAANAATTNVAHAVTGISCPSSGFCVTVDASGFIYTSTSPNAANTWTLTKESSISGGFTSVSCSPGTTATSGLCVATNGSASEETILASVTPGTGSSWVVPSLAETTEVSYAPNRGVSCPSTSGCMIIDSGYQNWANFSPGTTTISSWNHDGSNGSSFLSVACTSSFCGHIQGGGKVPVTGNAGSSETWSGTTPALTTGDALGCVPGTTLTTGLCLVGGPSGALTYNTATGAGAWAATQTVDGSNTIKSISCLSSSFCGIVDSAGNILTSTTPTSGSWTTTNLNSTYALAGVSCPEAGFCVAAGSAASGGNIVTLGGATPPVNTVAPVVSGTTIDGGTLSTTNGTWTGAPAPTFTYQWRDGSGSCTSASTAISGATSSTFAIPGSGDEGDSFCVTVTATNSSAAVPATSAATSAVTTSAPVNTELPSLSSPLGQQSVALTTTTGTWAGTTPITYTYQWYSCNSGGSSCSAISGATSSGYTPLAANVGNYLEARVTASNSSGSTTSTVLESYPTVPPAGTTAEYAAGNTNGGAGIATGPEGNIWFADYSGNKIGKITTSGVVTEYAVPSESHPLNITKGPEGNMWFTDITSNKIGKITPAGEITEYSAAAGANPRGITVGSDGNLWYTESSLSKIGVMSTAGTVLHEYPTTTNSYTTELVKGPDGNIWFPEYNASPVKIAKITPAGVVTEYPIPTAASNPVGITTGSNGSLYFAESGGNKIGRVTTNGFAYTDSSGNNVAMNLEGNGLQGGTLSSTSVVNNQSGPLPGSGSATFDGTTGWLGTTSTSVGNSAAPGETVEAWVKPTAVNAGSYQVIYSKTYVVQVDIPSSTAHVRVLMGNGWPIDIEGGTVTAGAWNHVVATYDGTTAKLYVNNALVASQTSSSGFSSVANIAAIGTNTWTIPSSGPPSSFFNGSISDVAVYNSALTATQVSSDYSASTQSAYDANVLSRSPAFYYKLNDLPFEYTVPTSGSEPTAITSGPDGNLWFTEAHGNKVGVMTTSGAFSEFATPTSGAGPDLGIATGSDANIWYSDANNSIAKITPLTNQSVPKDTALPTLSPETVTVGTPISATTGTWSGSPTSYSYQWQDCTGSGAGLGQNCTAISGATSSTYTPVTGDASHELRAVVTAVNASGQTAQLTPATITAPSASTPLPAISGSTVQGSTLTTTTGTFGGSAATSYSYQWQSCNAIGTCTNVGSNQNTYVIANSDEFKTIQVVVTATNAAGSATETSAATAAVTLSTSPYNTAVHSSGG